MTVGQFVYVIRKRIKLSPEKAIFIFVDEVLPPTAALMSSIYEEHKDEDGFLYITYVFFPLPFLPVLFVLYKIKDDEVRFLVADDSPLMGCIVIRERIPLVVMNSSAE